MGFPSPAADFKESQLSLDEHLIEHREATFFLRMAGSSMDGHGIHDGDLLVVDRAAQPGDGNVVVAVIDGDFLVRQLSHQPGGVTLRASEDGSQDIHIKADQELQVWGVVRYSIHRT